MQLTKQQETEIWLAYNTWLTAYLNADVKTYDAYFDDDYHFIGSTSNEEFLNRNSATNFFEHTGEQFAGKMDLRNEIKILEVFDRSIFITHFCDVWFLNDTDWAYYGRFRLSSVMRKKKEGWRFIYQHFSMPDSKSDEGETIGFDKVNAENIELKEAIKRRTIELESKNRDLEVEAALERVRSRTMGMQKSNELQEVVKVIFDQLALLSINAEHAGIVVDYEPKKDWHFWVAETQDIPAKVSVPYLDLVWDQQFTEAKKTGAHFFSTLLNFEEKNNFYKILLPHIEGLTEKARHFYFSCPGLAISTVIEKDIGLYIENFSGTPYNEKENDILMRFGKVFQQAYTRYLDIQKAEAQARESQIEAALERIRSKSLAMFKTDDLGDVVGVLFEQMQGLSVDMGFASVSIFIFDDDTRNIEQWQPLADEVSSINVPYFDHPISSDLFDAKDNGASYFEKVYTLEEKNTWLEHGFEYTDYKNLPEEFKNDLLQAPGYAMAITLAKNSGICIPSFLGLLPSPEDVKIMKRVGKVFEQAYIRFLDLQKAEAQAREAQIEAALEKVRSRSLAMHKSDELNDVVAVLFEKMKDLQIPFTAVGIATGIEGSKDLNAFVCGQNDAGLVITNYRLPYFNNPIPKDLYKALEKQSDFFVGNYSKEEKDTFYKYVIEHTAEFSHLPEDIKRMIFDSPTYSISMVAVKNAVFNVNEFEGKVLAESEIDIIKRFARVFDQAYTRFLDLQKAEAQAREAQIEAALERVRSRAMAMHSSQELKEVALELRKQMGLLGQKDLEVCAIHLYGDDEDSFESWSAMKAPGSEVKIVQTHANFPKKGIRIVDEMMHQFARGTRDYVLVNDGEKIEEWFKVMEINAPELYASIMHTIGKLPVNSLTANWSVADFSGGALVMVTYGEPDASSRNLLRRSANVFEQAYIRFLDLQKAEAQAREAKIEAALEKIRSRTMGMQSSEELQEVANLLFLEVQSLGIPSWSCGYNILSPDKKVATNFMSNEGTIQKPFDLPLTLEPSLLEFYRFLQSEESFFTQELGGKDLESHYNFMKSLPELTPVFEGIENAGIALPSYQINHLCKFTHGYLLFITYEPVPDAHDIFQRFTKVFDQTYTRFLDIKKAEAQTREAKIEVALEKVRSRTMGMQKSDELADVANVLFEEMNELVHNLWTCGFVLCEKDRAEDEWWLSLEDGFTRGFFLPNVNDYAHAHLYEGWLKKDDFRTAQLEGDRLQDHYDWLMEIPIAKSIFDDMEAAGMQRPEWQKLHAAYFSKGYLVIITREPCAEEAIFKRFAQVFDLTYTRFLDLQKAETQAREAQIEGALEKVRSRSLAMQSPAELIEVAQLLREEMGALGVEELETSSIYIHDENSGLTQCWFTIKNTDDPYRAVTDQMTIDLQDTWVGRQMLNFYRSPENQASILMQGANRKAWIQYCEEKSDLFGTSNFYGDTIPERTYHLYKFSNGYIGAAAPGEISKESWDLLKRATAVFSFAYTRFQDLQKAEASALAAMRQAALDRIRADISSMRHADDLDRITPLIFKELTVLGVPFIRCGVFIIQEKEEIVEAYLSSPDGNSLGVLKLPYQASELTYQTVEAWRKGEVYRQHWNKEDFMHWIEQLMAEDQIQDSNTYQGSAVPPESLDLHFVPFTQGMLYVGAISPLDNKELELVQALAKAFAIAFARYEDFVKLEKAKAEVESAMSELKATQSQLVQQEKLASLGQLTAGIAHEIKNPLNFVNNFSEVSIEMIEEVLEARSERRETRSQRQETKSCPENREDKNQEGEWDESEEIEDEILEDIRANLKKIHEHGSRANGIVTSMLQHSRGGTGKKEPTDINALIKEYSNLAFHGMRAGKNPISVAIDLQLDEHISNVPLVSEDFSRVLLNLCNNAFDAMRATAEIRPPKLTIRTKLQSEKILIEVEDNGPGIPDEIKDKILQPFFTTKKGTEGTGLGLSITHDIVKAHGGELRVESQEEAKTIFIVLLPTKL